MNFKKIIVCASVLFFVAIMTWAGESPVITFEKDVSPIFRKKCQECHEPGGMAPMSLVNYEEVRPWARSIQEKAVSREMPPFYAGGPIGYYENDNRLTDREIDIISKWVESGSPKGISTGESKETMASASERPVKPADLVLQPPVPYQLKNDGVDHFELFAFDQHIFAQDTWIRGIGVRPGNRSLVHHVVVYLLPANFKAGVDGRVDGVDAVIMGAQPVIFWTPGSLRRMFKDGAALLLPKGSRLGMQIHYAPTTDRQATDQTSIDIFYANGVVDKTIRVLYGSKFKIDIPPGESHYQLIDYKKFQTDALISTFSAHMHLRGKSFIIRLIYPDGRKETVFEIPQFYFNWQRGYTLAKPLVVPKGTVAEYTAVWDNSARNRFNPNPNQSVRFGLSTRDEMMSGSIVYVIPEEKLGLEVKHGVAGGAGQQ